jgi:hypothetical protein
MISTSIPTGEIVDPNGSPIHKDVLENNKYGPKIPYTTLLENLRRFQGFDNKSQNCVITSELQKPSPSYASFVEDANVCVPTKENGKFTISTDATTTQTINSEDVMKLRILLKEIIQLNEVSNRFFDLREKKAVDLLENNNGSEFSLRLHYLNRRDSAAFSNQVSLWVISALYIFLTFTVGYLYFTGKLETTTQKIIAGLPFAIPAIMIVLGYVTIGNYSLFLERT